MLPPDGCAVCDMVATAEIGSVLLIFEFLHVCIQSVWLVLGVLCPFLAG